MKIIHIFNSLKFSGAEIMYADAASIFQDEGYKLSAIATSEDIGEFTERFEQAGFEVFHYPYPEHSFFKKLKYIYVLRKFLKIHQFDVMHIHSNRMMYIMSMIAWMTKIKCLYTFHNVFPTRSITRPYHISMRWIVKNLFKCKFQTISDSVYSNELRTFKNKTIKINNWINQSRFLVSTAIEKQLIRQDIGLKEQDFVVISIGGCSNIKRHNDIITSISLLKENIPYLKYLHLGTGATELEEKMYAEGLEIDKNILFLGNRLNVRDYLAVSDVYVMTSKFEGISLTTVEAMTVGIPCILYDVPGLKDFKGQAILIAEDYEKLANEIEKIWNKSNDCIGLVERAQQFALEHYNMQKNVKEIIRLYQ